MRGLTRLDRYLIAGGVSLFALGLSPADAQDLQAIQRQIDSMQATIKDLQKQVADAKAEAAAAQ
jgi:hypothetical protein